MPLFETPEPTLEEKKAKAKLRIEQQARGALQDLKVSVRNSFNMVWNPFDDSLTPQDVLDAFGTHAAELFLAHQNISAFIISLDPTYEPLPPPVAYVINEDGTVTITV